MRDDLIGYLLGQLTPDEAASLQQRLQSDSRLQAELEAVRVQLNQMRADDDVAPPANLTRRTVSRIRHLKARQLTLAGTSGSWRLVDLAVAASILFIMSLVLIPALYQSRIEHEMADCGGNMQQIAVALETYSDQHGGFLPHADGQLGVSGIAAPLLLRVGLIKDPATFACPATNEPVDIPTFHQLQEVIDDAQRLNELLGRAGGSYAYPLGVLTNDQYYAPNRTRVPGRILLADRPGSFGKNSQNHGGRGQNVLFREGHWQFFQTPAVGPFGNDIYCNEYGQVKPSVHWNDTVLGRSGVRFRERSKAMR